MHRKQNIPMQVLAYLNSEEMAFPCSKSVYTDTHKVVIVFAYLLPIIV